MDHLMIWVYIVYILQVISGLSNEHWSGFSPEGIVTYSDARDQYKRLIYYRKLDWEVNYTPSPEAC